MSELEQILQDRNALALLGLLAHAYLTWDPPVPAGTDQFGKPDITHFRGLNIQAMVIDNTDGEILAIEKNNIHQEENPLAHAEQRAIKKSIDRLYVKRPRAAGMTVENWYRSQLFHQKGSKEADFIIKGATLYTTLEPCPFCASALLVARMKRVSFIIKDEKYGGSWSLLKEKYYKSYELAYDQLNSRGDSPASQQAIILARKLNDSIVEQRANNIQDTWFLDNLHNLLSEALAVIDKLDIKALFEGESREINGRTLADLKRLCKLPG
jgi:tRNA(Arg) A34 adenosine deaminase TadA